MNNTVENDFFGFPKVKWTQCSYSAINYLSNGINILGNGDPVDVKFGPKGTDRQ